MADHAARRYSALAGEVWKTRSGSAPVTSTSPLLYQSNSGPAWSFVSAMKPSSDMEAWAITFPIFGTFPFIGSLGCAFMPRRSGSRWSGLLAAWTAAGCGAGQPATLRLPPGRHSRGFRARHHRVAQVDRLCPAAHLDDLQLHVVVAEILDQPRAGAEQHGHQMHVNLVDAADPQQLLADAGTEDVDVPVTGGGLC